MKFSEQLDACDGIALLYMGSDRVPDEYTQRLRAAMEDFDVDEMEHVAALMVTLLYGRDDPQARLAAEKWNKAFLV
jgi:hypothetical protein